MDPYNETDRGRLARSIQHDYRQLEPFRSLVSSLAEEYAGPEYGNSSRPKREQLLNLMRQAALGYTMSLAANRPQVLLSTHHGHLKPFAMHYQQSTNNLLKEIRVEETIRQWILDAFFCLGVIKVHLADSGEVQLETDLWMDPGKPFASNIALDNFCFDMSATKWSEVKYAADSYRVPFEYLKNPELFDQDVVKTLQPTSKYAHANDEERLERISLGSEVDDDEYEPMIDLCDVWIPANGMVYTFAIDSRDKFTIKGPPLAEMVWDGPEFGPYHLLGFCRVPENIMPASTAAHLSGLARLANNLMRKMKRQAHRQKQVQTFTPAGKDSARKAKMANDGDWVEVKDTNEIGVLDLGGVNPNTQAFALDVVDKFDRMGGNLQAKLGLGSQAGTLGQDELIHAAASNEEAFMQTHVLEAVQRLVRDLGWMLWVDEVNVYPGSMPIEGAEGYSVDTTWTPEDREGDFFDYNFDVDVYSMPYQSPQQRVQQLSGLVTGIFAPLMPMLQQQGGLINLQKLTDIYSDLLNEPRLREVVQFSAMVPDMDTPGPAGTQPPHTTREYVRRNVPTGGTPQSRSHTMQQTLMQGGQVNPDQMNAMSMPVA